MIYYKFSAETPYCGTDHEEYFAYEKQPTEQELTETANEICLQNAESYEYLITGWDDENFEDISEEEQQELLDNYYADCSCHYQQITEEEYNEEMGVD